LDVDNYPTFVEQDRLAADRRALQRELTDRLAALYEKNLTFNELNFARGYEYGVVLNEAYEIARSKLEGGR
jgi:hypothetical protein